MKEEKFYSNGEVSRLLFRARSNTLALNDRFRHDRRECGRSTTCGLCEAEYEDLGHLILRCSKLTDERNIRLIRTYFTIQDIAVSSNKV